MQKEYREGTEWRETLEPFDKTVFWSSLPHKHKSEDICPSPHPGALFICTGMFYFMFSIYSHTHTENSCLFTVSWKDISPPTTQCSAIKLQNLSSKSQEPEHGEVQALPPQIFRLLKPITYRPALSLQKPSLVLQKTHVHGFTLLWVSTGWAGKGFAHLASLDINRWCTSEEGAPSQCLLDHRDNSMWWVRDCPAPPTAKQLVHSPGSTPCSPKPFCSHH